MFVDPESVRRKEYTVYLHTISKRSFNQPNGVYGSIAIPACPEDKRYVTFMRIDHPVMTPNMDPDNVSGPPIIRIENAKRLALGICNPDMIGTDLAAQDKEIPPYTQMSSGECNLTKQGVFASMNEVPTEEELQKAEKRREAGRSHRHRGFRQNSGNLQKLAILL